jgi:hypothetical protein
MNILDLVSNLLETAQLSPVIYNKIQTGRKLSAKEFEIAGNADLIPGGPNTPTQIRRKMLINFNKGRK